jgi:hypothetical protein
MQLIKIKKERQKDRTKLHFALDGNEDLSEPWKVSVINIALCDGEMRCKVWRDRREEKHLLFLHTTFPLFFF